MIWNCSEFCLLSLGIIIHIKLICFRHVKPASLRLQCYKSAEFFFLLFCLLLIRLSFYYTLFSQIWQKKRQSLHDFVKKSVFAGFYYSLFAFPRQFASLTAKPPIHPLPAISLTQICAGSPINRQICFTASVIMFTVPSIPNLELDMDIS